MHPMKRAFLIFVFGLGTVGGFAHGFASLHGRGACGAGRYDRRAAFEDHIAEVCTRAANRVNDAFNPHLGLVQANGVQCAGARRVGVRQGLGLAFGPQQPGPCELPRTAATGGGVGVHHVAVLVQPAG